MYCGVLELRFEVFVRGQYGTLNMEWKGTGRWTCSWEEKALIRRIRHGREMFPVQERDEVKFAYSRSCIVHFGFPHTKSFEIR